MMRIAEYKQIDSEVVESVVMVDDFDETGEIVGQHEETVRGEVPVMGLVYRDMTPEEVARAEAERAEIERIEEQREPTLEEKVDALLRYQGLTVKRVGGGVFEVVKEAMPKGDYTDPILFEVPMNVECGKWYYTEAVGKDLPRECVKNYGAYKAEQFDDPTIFDWV